ncbi:hypothetical protein L1987_34984 [Smallanthus sonchifolius]|uniref:Uncharacterized protein n=1 Tax=Smallanthus sonchifolius TaxID=185202 RepID=A0ACB9HX30_9ASTR|nr:hypothetical protein L1987_34984 [Smallanthus sonchifolius]
MDISILESKSIASLVAIKIVYMMEVDTSSQANGIMNMEVNNRSTRSIEKRPLEVPTPRTEAKKNPETDDSNTPVFINHGAIAWNEGRSQWVGDQSQKLLRMPKDPILSWSATYEDLLSTSNRFSEPIPLSEMVDFLVDTWHIEGMEASGVLCDADVGDCYETGIAQNDLTDTDKDEKSTRSIEKRPLEVPTPRTEAKKNPETDDSNTPVFINHGAIAWNEGRSQWVGDQSQKLQRMPKDPILSWSATYEDLLSTSNRFSEPIPLSEMVDFLVDTWHIEGLFD